MLPETSSVEMQLDEMAVSVTAWYLHTMWVGACKHGIQADGLKMIVSSQAAQVTPKADTPTMFPS